MPPFLLALHAADATPLPMLRCDAIMPLAAAQLMFTKITRATLFSLRDTLFLLLSL